MKLMWSIRALKYLYMNNSTNLLLHSNAIEMYILVVKFPPQANQIKITTCVLLFQCVTVNTDHGIQFEKKHTHTH